jgi:hypothetical protein
MTFEQRSIRASHFIGWLLAHMTFYARSSGSSPVPSQIFWNERSLGRRNVGVNLNWRSL